MGKGGSGESYFAILWQGSTMQINCKMLWVTESGSLIFILSTQPTVETRESTYIINGFNEFLFSSNVSIYWSDVTLNNGKSFHFQYRSRSVLDLIFNF